MWITQHDFAPYLSIYLQKTNGFQTFGELSPLACVATTKTILNKSGVNPGQGASAIVKMIHQYPSLFRIHFHEQGYKYHLLCVLS
jgi:hypothetical protein